MIKWLQREVFNRANYYGVLLKNGCLTDRQRLRLYRKQKQLERLNIFLINILRRF
jgi:hypothetical protein